MPRHDINNYIKGCNICLALKLVWHKLFDDLQSLPVPRHYWKNLLMDFITSLLISTDWKRNNYDSIFVIVNWLIKMVYYKSVKVIIDAPGFAKVIINIGVKHHGLPKSIITDRGLFFTSKFCSLLYYFLGIKQRLYVTFYP